MNESNIERIIISLIGTTIGFLFGLMTVYVKERRDRAARVHTMRMALELLALQLKDLLHEDPRLNNWLKIDAIFQFIDVIDDPRYPKTETDRFLRIYNQWYRGFYSVGGVKERELNSVKSELEQMTDFLCVAQANRGSLSLLSQYMRFKRK